MSPARIVRTLNSVQASILRDTATNRRYVLPSQISEDARTAASLATGREADFRVWRPKQGGPAEDPAWRKMRRGVADLYRRAQVSQKANERYLDALATVEDRATVEQLLTPLTRPAQWRGKRIRALRLFDAAETALLSAIRRPEFTLAGLRNRDLQRLLFDAPAATPLQRRRRGAWVSYRLRILRAHGLLRRSPTRTAITSPLPAAPPSQPCWPYARPPSPTCLSPPKKMKPRYNPEA
jgi:hypothetical protein